MMIASMDIAKGEVVTVSGASGEVTTVGVPEEMIERYALPGEVTVIDLDAVMGTGENRERIAALTAKYPCRVGGGIRTVEDAIRWLDAGAEKVIIGTAATPELFAALPASRTVAAIDVKNGEVVTNGGRTTTGMTAVERIDALKGSVGGFTVTLLDKMGGNVGIDMDFVGALKAAAGKKPPLTVAGGIATAKQIAALDALGVDAQLGTALHTGTLDLADAIVAPIKTDRPDGLFATVVVDEIGQAIGLVYSDMESIREAVKRKMGAYHSRSRGLWVKGLTSGNTQELLGVRLDCDRDALFFMVTQTGAGFCHNDTWSCWGDDKGIGRVSRLLERNQVGAPADLKGALVDSATQLAAASDKAAATSSAADLLFAALSTMAASGVTFKDVEAALYRRSLRVSKPGNED